MVLHFIFGLVASFLSGVAFGPINLSVVDITLKKNIRSALRFSMAASLAEIVHAMIAVMFGKLISKKIDEFPELNLLVIIFFVAIGLYFILKKDKPKSEVTSNSKKSNFVQGFMVAIFNPQVIPFWIFVLAYLKSSQTLYLKSWHLVLFLVGVLLGKFAILGIYGYLSNYINKHTNNLNDYVSKGIGGLLLAVGLFQAIKYFFF